jgi:undecaprenyl-diphosphatase
MIGRLAQRLESFARRFGDLDIIALVALLGLVIGVWGFVAIADKVGEGRTQSVDEYLIRLLRSPSDVSDPLGPPWLEEIGRDLTAIGGIATIALITAAVLGYLWISGKFHAAVFVIVAIGGGLGLSTVLKGLYDRPRPELVPHLSEVMTSSFPSGHSMMSAIVYLSLGSMLARLSERRLLKLYYLFIALSLTFLVGISRVYMGVHYPTDVLAGWAAGLGWAVLCWLLAKRLQRRGSVERAE